MASTNISKKRKFVADGVFYSELNEVRNLAREVSENIENQIDYEDTECLYVAYIGYCWNFNSKLCL